MLVQHEEDEYTLRVDSSLQAMAAVFDDAEEWGAFRRQRQIRGVLYDMVFEMHCFDFAWCVEGLWC